ncbi:MAG: response regulator [Candidatus Omnitrophota bacterium]|nr:MAG: response regulator [Candidatus Omnitrophota bacterium]
MIRRILESAGYRVLTAFSIADTFAVLREQVPDMIILSVIMPDGHGHEVCKTIKSRMEREDHFIPIILLTSQNETKYKIAGLESGADDYMLKPPSKQELLARVHVLLRNMDLQNELREAHDKLEREFKIVGDIQRSFLPREFPSHPILKLAACYEPSQQAGGDYYDVIEIDANHWGLVMADIAGHGVSAAVVMALTQWTVKEFARGITSPSKALTKFNQILTRHLTSEHFVTMFYAVLNLQRMELTYASAGHGAMLFYSAAERNVHSLKTKNGFPLKSFEGDEYDERKEIVQAGDRILLFTDGVVEMMDENHVLYGIDRLSNLLLAHPNASSTALVDKILDDSESFRKKQERFDDFTLMVVEHL